MLIQSWIALSAALVAVLATSGCVPLSSSQPFGEEAPFRFQAAKDIATPHGSFYLSDAYATRVSYPQLRDSGPPAFSALHGKLVNNTGKAWTQLTFQITYYDEAGAVLKSSNDTHLAIAQLPKEGLYIISGEAGRRITGPARARAYDLQFESGSYEVVYLISLVKPHASKQLYLQDGGVSLAFNITMRRIGLTLTNTTDKPVEVDWDKVSYVDISGQSHRVIHSGIRLIDRNSPQAPSVVAPGAKFSDELIPSENIHYTSGQYGGWNEERLLPPGPMAEAYVGKRFSVYLPVRIGGKEKAYNLVFKIDSVES